MMYRRITCSTRPLRSLYIMFQAGGSTTKWAGKVGWVYLLMVDTIMKGILLEAIGKLGIHLNTSHNKVYELPPRPTPTSASA